jgi:pyruvate-formate lyase-activating enzyme
MLPAEGMIKRLAGLSFTFNEPVLWFEYTLDAAKLARQKGFHTKMLGCN